MSCLHRALLQLLFVLNAAPCFCLSRFIACLSLVSCSATVGLALLLFLPVHFRLYCFFPSLFSALLSAQSVFVSPSLWFYFYTVLLFSLPFFGFVKISVAVVSVSNGFLRYSSFALSICAATSSSLSCLVFLCTGGPQVSLRFLVGHLSLPFISLVFPSSFSLAVLLLSSRSMIFVSVVCD